MYPHRIRLRGPWEAEPIGTGPGGPAARRVTLPARWGDIGLGDFRGVVRLRRRFGLPRRLDDWERVWLTCAGHTGPAAWHLNGTELRMQPEPGGRVEAEITPLLRERNELVVDVEAAGPEGGLWGEVALEVRCRAYLRGVRAIAQPAEVGWVVQVGGMVVRECLTDPLELYLQLDGRNQDYLALQSDQRETPFHFWAPVEHGHGRGEVSVRVDLVNGAVLWHTEEVVVALSQSLGERGV